MKITIEKDNLDEFWVVTINDITTMKAKTLYKVVKALLGFAKGHPEVEK